MTKRIYFRDIKPFSAPNHLSDLQGPNRGTVHLHRGILWAPGDGWINLDEPGGVDLAYRAVLAEGSVEDQVQILNAKLLVQAWPDLMLPDRVRELWESRFPELTRE